MAGHLGAALVALLLLSGAQAVVRTFGSPTRSSWPSARLVLGRPAVTILNHTIGPGSWGCMSHFWVTSESDLAMAGMGVRLEVSYYFDGEPVPSVAFEPAMMAGNGWAAAPLAGQWQDAGRQAGKSGIYAAGDRVGRGGTLTGWWNNIKLPFNHSVVVTAGLVPRPGAKAPQLADPPPGPYLPTERCRELQPPDSLHCINADIIVRGFEDTANDVRLSLRSGLQLPRSARMKLHKFEDKVPGFQIATLASFPSGYQGVIYGNAMAIETSPPWGHMGPNGQYQGANSWVEGCWNLQRKASEPLPGLALGTGFEDYFDSDYGFNVIGPDPEDPTSKAFSPRLQRVCSANGTGPFERNPATRQHGLCSEGVLFQHPTQGLVHYSADLTPRAVTDSRLNMSEYGVERVSAYRFLDAEIVAFEDGGALVWRNNDPGPMPKCRCEKGEPAVLAKGSPAVVARSYVWAYQWPIDS